MFKSIVVATDGSRHGGRAVDMARAMAEADGAKLVVVHVTELALGKGGNYPVNFDEDEVVAELRDQVEQMCAAGIQAEFSRQVLSLGGPAHVIADVAKAAGADLIVVGSRGHSPLTQIILGSVPVRLLQIAACPVLVVPPAEG